MATTVKINHRTVTLSIEQKARLLSVFALPEEGNALVVTSGSLPNTAYVVRHNGEQCQYCPCKAGKNGLYCSHQLAGDWFLAAQRRAVYVERFDPHCCELSHW
jgi:hypothetical protein